MVVGKVKGWIRRAVVAVEMALVLPLLLIVLVGSIQYGAIFYLKNNMISAAREGARVMAIKDATAAQGQQAALKYLAGWSLIFNITSHVPPSGSTVDHDVWVDIKTPFSAAAPMLNAFNLVPAGDVHARATMRKEI
jgi:Flp pilus assembly protein TadG